MTNLNTARRGAVRRESMEDIGSENEPRMKAALRLLRKEFSKLGTGLGVYIFSILFLYVF